MDKKTKSRVVWAFSLLGTMVLAHVYLRCRVVSDLSSRHQFLENSSHLLLFSLDPSPLGVGSIDETTAQRKRRTTVEEKDDFHGARILREVEITDPAMKKRLLKALHQGIQEERGWGAMCFSPRHGIRATSGLTTLDLNICFQCSTIKVASGPFRDRIGTTRTAQEVFDSTLDEAGTAMGSRPNSP